MGGPVFLWNVVILDASRPRLVVVAKRVLIAHRVIGLVWVRHGGVRIDRATAIAQITLVVCAPFDSPAGRLVAAFAPGHNLIIEWMSFSNATVAAFAITAANRICRHNSLRITHYLKPTTSLYKIMHRHY